MYGCYYLTKSIKQSTQLETAADTLLRSNLNMNWDYVRGKKKTKGK
jgi:hypothetical protein